MSCRGPAAGRQTPPGRPTRMATCGCRPWPAREPWNEWRWPPGVRCPGHGTASPSGGPTWTCARARRGPWSGRRVAAIDVQHRAGDVAGRIGGEENGRPDELARAATPGHGGECDDLVLLVRAVVLLVGADHNVLEVPGRDGVDTHPPGGPLDRHHTGHLVHA